MGDKNKENSLLNSTVVSTQYRKAVSRLLVLCIIAIVLSVVLFLQIFYAKSGSYYATTSSGSIVSLKPLDEPTVKDDILLQWSEVVVRDAFNIGFLGGEDDVKAAKSNFTSGGWTSFQSSLQTSGLLDDISSQKLNMSAIVSGAPVILFQGKLKGAYIWRVQMPLLINFQSASTKKQMNAIATINISRVPVLTVAKGIQVSDFSVSVSNSSSGGRNGNG